MMLVRLRVQLIRVESDESNVRPRLQGDVKKEADLI
jgi:hypothetical protein